VSSEHRMWLCPFQVEVLSQGSGEFAAVEAVTVHPNCVCPLVQLGVQWETLNTWI
jgi:hypothetical protein